MQNKLERLCHFLESDLIERSTAVRLILLAAISGEHSLLIGPPGTAKSQLARKLHTLFEDTNYFERMLTRFSVPEELFGPLSIKALEEDRYQRLTHSYLPEAGIAFIDEIFKANSAILNSLLTLLNEREFDNGATRQKTPLVSVIAASNELPTESELEALYDRFLIRFCVDPVSDDGFQALINISSVDGHEIPVAVDVLGRQEIIELQYQSQSIPLHESAVSLLQAFRNWLIDNNIYVSDRRWRKAVHIMKVAAASQDEKLVTQWHCSLLLHMLWHTPDEYTIIENWFIEYLDLDVENALKRIGKLVETWEVQIQQDLEKHRHKTNAQGEYLYQSPEGTVTTQHERVTLAERNGDLLYLAPPDQDDRTNQGKGYTLRELEASFFDDSFKQTHIDGRWVDVQNYINNTQNRLVDRVSFTPLVEAYYFESDYVNNQYQELSTVLDDVIAVSTHFQDRAQDIAEARRNIWISSGVLEIIQNQIDTSMAHFVDYQQRLQKLLKDTKTLKTRPHRVTTQSS